MFYLYIPSTSFIFAITVFRNHCTPIRCITQIHGQKYEILALRRSIDKVYQSTDTLSPYSRCVCMQEGTLGVLYVYRDHSSIVQHLNYMFRLLGIVVSHLILPPTHTKIYGRYYEILAMRRVISKPETGLKRTHLAW